MRSFTEEVQSQDVEAAVLVEEALPEQLPQSEPELVLMLDRVLRRLTAVVAMQEANGESYRREVQRLADRLGECNLPLSKAQAYLERDVETLGVALLALHPSKKSRRLLYGTVSQRTVPARLEVKDEKLLAASLGQIEAQLYIPQPPKLDKRELDRYFRETGAVPPGCEQVSEREAFSYKLSGKD
jgi:hypothetical protein